MATQCNSIPQPGPATTTAAEVKLPRRLSKIHNLRCRYDKIYDATYSHEMVQLIAVLAEYLSQPEELRREYEVHYLGIV